MARLKWGTLSVGQVVSNEQVLAVDCVQTVCNCGRCHQGIRCANTSVFLGRVSPT